jgi:hypothetical protein
MIGPMSSVTQDRALGISLHTGWAACVVVGGSLQKPQIFANEIIEILGSSERFCFHLAAEMEYAAVETWIARMKEKAVVNARRALSPLLAQMVGVCAIVAKEGAAGDLREVLNSHPRLHAAEGFFYRDVLREACPRPTQIISPKSLDPSKVPRCAPAPWGRDQKLAALAGWSAM